jgi:hypothetical protein
MKGNHTNIQGPCDLDLWPSDPKINRGHLLVMTNQYVKYEDFVMHSFQDNKRTPFWHLRPSYLDLWTSDPKSITGHLLVTTNHYVKYEDFAIITFQDNELKT